MSLFMPASAYVFWSQLAAATRPRWETKKHFLVLSSAVFVLNYFMKPSMEAVTQLRALDLAKLMAPRLTGADEFRVMVMAWLE